MGYCISEVDCVFFIPAKDVVTALTALNEGMPPTLEYGALHAARWFFTQNENGDVTYIGFDGEKGRCDDELEPLAPYVKDDSYVEMLGEDGARWRWIFKNGKIVTKDAKLTW